MASLSSAPEAFSLDAGLTLGFFSISRSLMVNSFGVSSVGTTGINRDEGARATLSVFGGWDRVLHGYSLWAVNKNGRFQG